MDTNKYTILHTARFRTIHRATLLIQSHTHSEFRNNVRSAHVSLSYLLKAIQGRTRSLQVFAFLTRKLRFIGLTYVYVNYERIFAWKSYPLLRNKQAKQLTYYRTKSTAYFILNDLRNYTRSNLAQNSEVTVTIKICS